MSTGSRNIVLGLDGGGTNTRAVISRGTTVLGRAKGGSIKRLRVGAEAAEANLRNLLRDVFTAADVTRVDAASAGIASASLPGVADWITAVFEDVGICNSEVVGDEVIALDAAVRGGPGILQIAGTGSNCFGRSADGARENAGGYSSTLGDEGSGYWIGLYGVRQALRAHDHGEPCTILQRVAAEWGTNTLEELVSVGNQVPGPDFSALAPLMSVAAEEGDSVAIRVLHQAAADLADFVLLVRSKLRQHHGITEEVPVAFTGSVLEKIGIVRVRFTELLKQAAPDLPVAQEGVVAVEGALWRARRLAES
ncbi:N-acetylglucosamine kinase [Acidicapsa ligni]|uniref:N-acetylglucosamine kinase n=1 Tax=Acidicapsa ligni TaxID=542300 RepID=UPI0021E0ABBC|nr:BadF/BadG/BcrA/BcrD ATPase family protein [Acidicapsa ligni]